MRIKIQFLTLLMLVPIFFTAGLLSAAEITKGPRDSKQYRMITLDNRLQVLLISDPETDQAAAAMNIQTGSFNDPADRAGLTHFLEHMLFLGTDQYPDPSDYSRFLAEHGGGSNAFTATENTNFHFNVDKRYLKGALKRFSRFFIAPLFDEKFVEREVNAVHAEHQKNLRDDGRRKYQVLRETSNPNHPFHKFSTGDKTTLTTRPDLRKELVDYYDYYYSSNLMQLAIAGKESLDQLEDMAKTYFSEIPDKDREIPSWDETPLPENLLPRIINIQPIRNVHQLTYRFPTPPSENRYKKKSSGYIANLIGDEGPGSILSLLKEKGYATGLSAGGWSGRKTSKAGFFTVNLELTPSGVDHIKEITSILFSYISKIEKSGIQEWRYEEQSRLAQIDLDWEEKQTPYQLVRYLASRISVLQPEDLLIGDRLYLDYDEKDIRNLLGFLTPDNMQMELMTPGVTTNKKDPWYQTPYSVNSLNGGQLKRYRDVREKTDFNKALALPVKNPYIPDEIKLAAKDKSIQTPKLISDKKALRTWYFPDYQFHQPTTAVKAVIGSPIAYDTRKHAALTKMLLATWQDFINHKTYPFFQAGGYFSSSHRIEGIELSASGYYQSLSRLLPVLLTDLRDFPITEEKFELHKQQMLRSYNNQKQSQPVSDAAYHSYYLMHSPLWHREDYLQALQTLTLKELKDFRKQFLEQLAVKTFIHGNLSISEASSISRILADTLKIEPAKALGIAEDSWLDLKPGSDFTVSRKTEDKNSAVVYYAQTDGGGIQDQLKIKFISLLLEEAVYKQLRTIEQLGYIVSSYPISNLKNNGFLILVQSPGYSPEHLDRRIRHFLKSYNKEVQSLTEKEFQTLKTTLRNQLAEPFQKRSELNQFLWSEIQDQTFRFDYKKQALKRLKEISKKDIIRLYRNLFIAKNKKVLAVRIHPDQFPASSKLMTLEKLKTFKSSQTYKKAK